MKRTCCQWWPIATNHVDNIHSLGLDKTLARLNDKDRYGFTPLMRVAKAGYVPLARYLIANGANTKASTCWGKTVLMYAADGDSVAMLRLLIAFGADVNAIDRDGGSALLNAASSKASAVKALLRKGAKVDVPTCFGWTPLMEATEWDQSQAVDLLIQYGADVNAREWRYGRTALMIAAINDNVSIAKKLFKAGAKLTVETFDKETALILAKSYKHEQIVELLSKNEVASNKEIR